MPRPHRPPRAALLAALVLAAACNKDSAGNPAPTGPRAPPILRFEGLAYVDAGTSDFKILERVRQETLSIFPGLRRSRVMVSRRDVHGADVESFRREVVTVAGPGDQRRPALRVRFRYVTIADVAPDIPGQLEIPMAALHRSRGVDTARILRECSTASPDDRQASSALNLVFDPTLDSCKAAIQAEQAAIDAAREALPGGSTDVVPVEEVERLYIPITITLAAIPPGASGDPAPRAPGRYPRYEPFDPEIAARQLDELPEEPPAEPPKEIVDPEEKRRRDLEHDGPPAPDQPGGQPPAAAPRPAVGPDGKPLPAPSAAQPQTDAEVAAARREMREERFEISWDIFADPRFLVVWLSLLMVYPILRGERKKKA